MAEAEAVEQEEQDEEEQALMILPKPCEHQKRLRGRRKTAISAPRLPPPQVVEEVNESGEGVWSPPPLLVFVGAPWMCRRQRVSTRIRRKKRIRLKGKK
jgi:hypothetical protein